MTLRTVRLEHNDVVKIFFFRNGEEPETHEEFLAIIASKIPTIVLALANHVLRMFYVERDSRTKVALEDDDDILAMFHDNPPEERLHLVAILENVGCLIKCSSVVDAIGSFEVAGTSIESPSGSFSRTARKVHGAIPSPKQLTRCQGTHPTERQ
ncbi:hypothetical protein HDU93_005455 [Gonapodya sp. JEL0774]|nr:hypothetical protein HDU93_005455 [Gonapodya sp. JEL0774]